MTTNTSAGVGSSSITTLGTITTGVWNGTIIDLSHGGSNANLTASNGGIVYSTASAMAILSGTATANQVLLSGSSTTPAWSTATYPATTTANQLLYSSATNTVGGLSSANSAVLVTNSSGVPAFSGTMTNGQLIIGSTSGTPTAATLTQGSGVTITNGAGTITIAATGGGGGWVQSVQTNLTTVNNTSVTGGSWSDIPGMSVSITPGSSSNKVMILAHITSGTDFSTTSIGYFRLVRGSTAIDVSSAPQSNQLAATGFLESNTSTSYTTTTAITFIDSPATTSSTTYKLQYTGFTTCTMYINRTAADTNSNTNSRYASTIIAVEIST